MSCDAKVNDWLPVGLIGELFSDEISIAISDIEEYIYYRPSKRIDLKIRPGKCSERRNNYHIFSSLVLALILEKFLNLVFLENPLATPPIALFIQIIQRFLTDFETHTKDIETLQAGFPLVQGETSLFLVVLR